MYQQNCTVDLLTKFMHVVENDTSMHAVRTQLFFSPSVLLPALMLSVLSEHVHLRPTVT